MRGLEAFKIILNKMYFYYWIPDQVRDDKLQVRDDKLQVRDDNTRVRDDNTRVWDAGDTFTSPRTRCGV